MSTPSKQTGTGGQGSSSNTPTQNNNSGGGGSGRSHGRDQGSDRGRSVPRGHASAEETTAEDGTHEGTNASSAGTSSGDPDGVYLSGDDLQLIGPNARRVADDPSKHKPITKKGAKFHWDANEHITKDPPAHGVASRSATELTLIDEGGNRATWIYPRRQALNFANQRDLDELQKWRLQIIKRRLDQNDDGQSRKTVFRQHWTDQEKDYLKELVLRNINANKRPLNNQDWATLAKGFNNRFKGWPIKVGEATPPHAKGGDVWTESSLAKKSHIMVERNASAIKSQAFKYEDVKEEMDRALEAYGQAPDTADAQTDNGTDDGEDDRENNEEYADGEEEEEDEPYFE